MNRIRVGLYLTSLLGVMWCAAGIFTSLTDVGWGAVVAAAGVIGWGLVDYMEKR